MIEFLIFIIYVHFLELLHSQLLNIFILSVLRFILSIHYFNFQ